MDKSKFRIMLVFGTRPEAIKMAPVLKALKYEESIEVRCCVTGQHRSMLDQILRTFGITPDFDLDIMRPNQTLTGITVRIMEGLDGLFLKYRPDVLLVHGDTTTATAAAITAFYHRIKVGHVEAGLRTGDLMSPWPEEMNRVVVDRIADYMFAPTEASAKNLYQEGLRKEKVFVTGNTVIDALLHVVSIQANNAELKIKLNEQVSFLDPARKLILVTGHRRESFGDGFRRICEAIAQLSQRKDVQVVYPVHLNPAVQKPVNERLSVLDNVHLIEPCDYLLFVYLMNHSTLILTDSGGVQEEAPSLGKPVLVMRDVTERPEAVEAGTVRLVGSNVATIVANATELLDDSDAYEAMSRVHNPYGDGAASKRIVDVLMKNCL